MSSDSLVRGSVVGPPGTLHSRGKDSKNESFIVLLDQTLVSQVSSIEDREIEFSLTESKKTLSQTVKKILKSSEEIRRDSQQYQNLECKSMEVDRVEEKVEPARKLSEKAKEFEKSSQQHRDSEYDLLLAPKGEQPSQKKELCCCIVL